MKPFPKSLKKDFVDLYFILAKEKILDLEKTLNLYGKKFKALKENQVHILKSLVYFKDAEKDALPKMIQPVKWSLIKKFFINEQKK